MEENIKKEEKTKKNKKKIWIIAGLTVLILVMLTVSILLFFKKDQDTPNELSMYTVTFDTDGGSIISSRNIKEGEVLELPKEEPTKEGYLFEKWLLEEKEIPTDYEVYKDITLKANWIKEAIAMMIHFDSNGGNSIPSIVLEEGTEITLPNEPTKEGYNFLGWYLGEEKIENGKIFEKVETLTLKARWEKTTVSNNKNILEAYTYNLETCQTGEETTCVKLTSLPQTVEAGTIIKYRVSNTEVKYFHVMFDNGKTLTMQQRENTKEESAWSYGEPNRNTKDDNKLGPTTALSILENATKGWTYVKTQTYTPGTTVFKENAYTGCGDNNSLDCIKNVYTMKERNGKARMITAQEAKLLGCKLANMGTCPVWMTNYLTSSTSYGGKVEGEASGYWTMSATSFNSIYALYVNFTRMIRPLETSGDNYTSPVGVRAVVVIDK